MEVGEVGMSSRRRMRDIKVGMIYDKEDSIYNTITIQ